MVACYILCFTLLSLLPDTSQTELMQASHRKLMPKLEPAPALVASEPEPMPESDYYKEDPTAEAEYDDKTTKDCVTHHPNGAEPVSARRTAFSLQHPLAPSLLVLLLQ